MQMQTVVLILLVLVGAYLIFTSREGLAWDRGFAGFLPAVSGEINLGSLEVPGDRLDKVAVSDKVIKKLVDGVCSKISMAQKLSVSPIETVFIEVYGSKGALENLEKERPDVYGAYIKYLEEKDKQNSMTKEEEENCPPVRSQQSTYLESLKSYLNTLDKNSPIYGEYVAYIKNLEEAEKRNAALVKNAGNGTCPKVRTSLVSYLDTLKNGDPARIPPEVPLTYRTRLLLLETKRYYGMEVDAVCVGNANDMRVLGITTKTVEKSGNIQPFVSDLKAGEWVPYADILKRSFGSTSILEKANEAIEAKLKR